MSAACGGEWDVSADGALGEVLDPAMSAVFDGELDMTQHQGEPLAYIPQ